MRSLQYGTDSRAYPCPCPQFSSCSSCASRLRVPWDTFHCLQLQLRKHRFAFTAIGPAPLRASHAYSHRRGRPTARARPTLRIRRVRVSKHAMHIAVPASPCALFAVCVERKTWRPKRPRICYSNSILGSRVTSDRIKVNFLHSYISFHSFCKICNFCISFH